MSRLGIDVFGIAGTVVESREQYFFVASCWHDQCRTAFFCFVGSSDLLTQASAIADAIEQLADQLTPSVIRAARADQQGRADLDRIEYALGTIGKALILTDYSIDQEKDIDKLQAFRESQQR